MARRKSPRIPDALLDQLLAGADPKTAFDANGLIDELKKALAERALNAEMDHHLAEDEAGNSRNGYGRKTVTTETGRIELEIPGLSGISCLGGHNRSRGGSRWHDANLPAFLMRFWTSSWLVPILRRPSMPMG